jgi:P-type E1-E2 ATPase
MHHEVRAGWEGQLSAISFFKIAISLAVAAIPEGMRAVVPMMLLLCVNLRPMQTAIATKSPAMETFGYPSLVCSGKTGTLTTNEMMVNTFSIVRACDAAAF